MVTNIDCLVNILSRLSVRDRHKCRLINSSWRESSDHLSIAQKRLVLVSKYQSYRLKYEDSENTIVWTTSYVKYNTYLDLINQFPNLRSLTFIGFDYWNDSLVNHLIISCPALTSLEFISCDGLGRNRNDDYCYMNVTENGWRQLVSAYGQQMTKLVITDCDLDGKQLDIIVNGFTALVFLDITGNHIRNYECLRNICGTIEVIKLGPRLINGDNQAIELPLESLMAGNGLRVKELHIQGFLTRQLSSISSFAKLNTLVVKFIKPLFGDQDLEFFHSVSSFTSLECLELYECNSHDGIMSLSHSQLNLLIRSCSQLKKLVLNCDVWCDSVISNSIMKKMSEYNKNLKHLSLCPGNFKSSDNGLEWLAKLPALETVQFTGFPAFTDLGFIKFIQNCQTLRNCFLEDCFVITQTFIDCLILIFSENPNRLMNFQLSQSRITAQIPKQLPSNLKISLSKQKNIISKPQTSSSDNRFFWQTFLSLITYISGLSVITLTLIVYFIHLFLSEILSKISLLFIPLLLTTVSIIPLSFFTNIFKDFFNASYGNISSSSEEDI